MLLRLVACVLVLTVALSLALPVSASDTLVKNGIDISFESAEDSYGANIKGKFTTNPSVDLGIGAIDGDYYYRDSYFTAPATVYNPHLATMSMALTLSSFWADHAWNYYMQYDNAVELLSDVGFEHIEANLETDGRPTADTIGVLMSHKTVIETNGEPYNLVTITIRSSSYGSEWASNMLVGNEQEYNGDHKGFSMARDRALEFILPYLEKHIEGNTKFWITGFSRGGAVGGLLGAWMDDNIRTLEDMNVKTGLNDIFTYTFEAPTSMLRKNTAGKNYSNIFNIMTSEDPIVYLPFGGSRAQGWDFVHPGEVRKYPAMTAERIASVERELYKLNPYFEYTLDEFVPFMNPLGKNMATFLANFSKAFTMKIDRQTYATTIERDFSRLAAQFMSGSDDETREMFERLGPLILEKLGATEDSSPAELTTLLISVLGGSEQAIDSLCRTLGECMEEVGALEVYDDTAHSCLKNIFRILLSTQGGNLVPYVITIVINNSTFTDAYGREKKVNMIFGGHAQEITLASLMADDAYYKGGSLVEFQEPNSADTVTVSVNTGEKTYNTSYKSGTRVTLSADTFGCYCFDAWYIGEDRVSESAEYSFIADKSTDLRVEVTTNHLSIGDWVIEREATDDEDGLQTKTCSSCGELAESQIIPKLKAPEEPKAPEIIDQAPKDESGIDPVVAIAVLSVVAIVALGGGMGLMIFVFSRRKYNSNKQK